MQAVCTKINNPGGRVHNYGYICENSKPRCVLLVENCFVKTSRLGKTVCQNMCISRIHAKMQVDCFILPVEIDVEVCRNEHKIGKSRGTKVQRFAHLLVGRRVTFAHPLPVFHLWLVWNCNPCPWSVRPCKLYFHRLGLIFRTPVNVRQEGVNRCELTAWHVLVTLEVANVWIGLVILIRF